MGHVGATHLPRTRPELRRKSSRMLPGKVPRCHDSEGGVRAGEAGKHSPAALSPHIGSCPTVAMWSFPTQVDALSKFKVP